MTDANRGGGGGGGARESETACGYNDKYHTGRA